MRHNPTRRIVGVLLQRQERTTPLPLIPPSLHHPDAVLTCWFSCKPHDHKHADNALHVYTPMSLASALVQTTGRIFCTSFFLFSERGEHLNVKAWSVCLFVRVKKDTRYNLFFSLLSFTSGSPTFHFFPVSDKDAGFPALESERNLSRIQSALAPWDDLYTITSRFNFGEEKGRRLGVFT